MMTSMSGRSTLTATGVPSGSSREMHLRHRGARDRRAVERLEHLVDRLPEAALERRDHLFDRERRHAVLQLRELVGNVGRQQVAPRGQHLPELHEDRSQRLEGQPQPDRARLAQVAPEQHAVDPRAHRAQALVRQQDVVQPEADRDSRDAGEAQDPHAPIVRARNMRPSRSAPERRACSARMVIATPASRGQNTKRGRRLRAGASEAAAVRSSPRGRTEAQVRRPCSRRQRECGRAGTESAGTGGASLRRLRVIASPLISAPPETGRTGPCGCWPGGTYAGAGLPAGPSLRTKR